MHYHQEWFNYIIRTHYILQNSAQFFISMNNPVFYITFLTDQKKSCLKIKENLCVLLHSQYDYDLLGHLIPSIRKTKSLFPTIIDILNSIYWPPIALLYCLIEQSGNCYASLKMPCCHLNFHPLVISC